MKYLIQKNRYTFLYYGTLFYIFLFYFQPAGRYSALSPLRLELIIGSILVLISFIKISKGEINLKENRMNLAAGLFLLSAAATIPFAFVKQLAFDTFIRLLKFFAIYLMIIVAINDEKELKGFIYVFLIMISILFVEPFLLSLQGKGFIYNNHMMRLAGITKYFAHPNQLGGLTATHLPFFYFLMKYEKSITMKILYILLMMISFRVIMLTQSRTAFVGALAVGFFVWYQSKNKIIYLIISIIIAVILWSVAPQQTRERFLTFRDVDEVITGEKTEVETGSMGARWTLTKHGFEVFIENPLLGVGLDNFRVASARKWSRWIPPHNTYIQVLSEMGLIGFIIFLTAIIITFKNLRKAKEIVYELGLENSFLFGLISAMQVHFYARLVVSCFGQDLYDNYWWLIGGLSLVILRIVKNKQAEKVEWNLGSIKLMGK